MNIQFRKIYLPQLPEVNANALIKLAKNKHNNGLQPPNLPAGVTKTKIVSRSNLDEIIRDIENHKTENITPLEWVHCIYNKDKWDVNNKDKSISTSEAIWKAAEQNAWLKQKLFWNLVLNSKFDNFLASSLANSYKVFSPQDRLDREILKIIQIITTSEPANNLATLCRQRCLTPYQLFQKYRLPTKSLLLEQTLDKIVFTFAWNATPNQQVKWLSNRQHNSWLLNCLEEMRRIQQIQAVELLLTQVDPKVGAESLELINWLRQYYSSAVANSRWNELSSEAKAAMRKWLGAVSYQDFQKLVSLVLHRVELETWEKNRLETRKDFWSNYSDRFERIRILLPQSSVDVLRNCLNHQDVSILLEDGSELTEVCIFDFGAWFVAEFFRGNGSETRLFRKNLENEHILFNSRLSIKKLRSLDSNNGVHDHEYVWQYFCEQLLREEKGILPNKGTDRFKGVPYQYNKYNFLTGLPKPSYENLKKRDRKLQYWREEIARLEREARE